MTQNDTIVSNETKNAILNFIHPINHLMAECAEKYTSQIQFLGTLKKDNPIVFFLLENRIFSINLSPDNYYKIMVYNSDFTACEGRPSVMRDELNQEIFELLEVKLKEKDKSKMKALFTFPMVKIPMSIPWVYTFLREKQIQLTDEPSPDIIGFEIRDLVTEIYRNEENAKLFVQKLREADLYHQPVMPFFKYLTNKLFNL